MSSLKVSIDDVIWSSQEKTDLKFFILNLNNINHLYILIIMPPKGSFLSV